MAVTRNDATTLSLGRDDRLALFEMAYRRTMTEGKRVSASRIVRDLIQEAARRQDSDAARDSV